VNVDQALRDVLARIADLLGLRTGWIWLIDPRTGPLLQRDGAGAAAVLARSGPHDGAHLLVYRSVPLGKLTAATSS